MTVKQLRNMLKNFDDDKEVYFGYPYNDRRGTTVAAPVENVEEVTINHSNYHNSMILGGESEEPQEVVLLND